MTGPLLSQQTAAPVEPGGRPPHRVSREAQWQGLPLLVLEPWGRYTCEPVS